MPIHALIAPVRTRPKPAILADLHGLDEVLAHLVRRRLWVPVLAHHHLPQLLLVPLRHIIFLLLLLLSLSHIRIQVLLLALPLNIQIVTEFALPSLVAIALLVELA